MSAAIVLVTLVIYELCAAPFFAIERLVLCIFRSESDNLGGMVP